MMPHPSNLLSLSKADATPDTKNCQHMKIFSYWKSILARPVRLESFPRHRKKMASCLRFIICFSFLSEKECGRSRANRRPHFFPPRSSFSPAAATLMTHSATVTVTLQCKFFRRAEHRTDWSSHFCLCEKVKSVDMEFWHELQKKKVHFQRVLLQAGLSPRTLGPHHL